MEIWNAHIVRAIEAYKLSKPEGARWQPEAAVIARMVKDAAPRGRRLPSDFQLIRQCQSVLTLQDHGFDKRPKRKDAVADGVAEPDRKRIRLSRDFLELETLCMLSPKPNETWKDLIGGEAIQSAAQPLLEALQLETHLRDHLDSCGRLSRSLVIEGPRGAGKTTLARAILGSTHATNIRYIYVDGYQLATLQKGEDFMKQLVQLIEESCPCVCLIDDLDVSLPAANRSQKEENLLTMGNATRPKSVSARLLRKAIESLRDHRVLFLATCESADKLDPFVFGGDSFLRSSCFKILPPDEGQRLAFLARFSQGVKLSNVNLDTWAVRSAGAFAEDLRQLVSTLR